MSYNTKCYRESKKFNDWCEYFLNKRYKKTYGNATQAALKVYNAKGYSSAGVIGHENLKKLKVLSSVIAEQEGFGYAEMIRIGLQKMQKSEDVKWWREMMIMLGYYQQNENISIAHEINFAEEISKSSLARNLNP